MLDNTITLPVDVLNNNTPVNEAFSRYDEYQNRSVYIGPGHALDARNQMTLYRTLPKQAGTFRGVAKSAIKFSADVVVSGTDTSDITASEIGEISFSLPVGTTAARAKALRQRMIALLDDDALCAALTERLEI